MFKFIKGIVAFIRRWFPRGGKEADLTLQAIENFDFPEGLRVYLIGFSYDTPTKQTFGWIRDILKLSPRNETDIFRFHNDDFDKSNLATCLRDSDPRVELFCGHGSRKGLYGPPYFTNAEGILFRRKHSIIYDADMITPTQSSMFAFCCDAAHNFGSVYTSFKGKQFMGFTGEIPLPKELYEDFKNIFQSIGRDIIQSGGILAKHREMFLKEVDKLIVNSDNYKNPTLIKIWLTDYKRLLKVYV